MTDISHLQDDVAYVRTHVENLERMIAHQIRNNPQAKETATRLFADTPDLARVYLAFSAPASQQAIIANLGLDKSKVSRLVKALVRHDYLRKLNDGTYTWTEFERLLDLSRIAGSAAKLKTKSEQVIGAAETGREANSGTDSDGPEEDTGGRNA